VARKHIVKVVLSLEQKEILDNICRKMGQSESETLRIAFLEYAKSISLITEKVHGKTQLALINDEKRLCENNN